MRNQPITMGTLTIASATTDSLALELRRRPITALAIYAPATLPETVTVQVSPDGTNWATHPVTAGIGAANVIIIEPIAFSWLRLHAGVAAAADRTFVLEAAEDIL